MTPEVFAAIHRGNVRLDSPKAFFDWAAGKGLDRKKVEDMFNSFAIGGKMNKANQAAKTYQVQSVPLVIVGPSPVLRQVEGIDWRTEEELADVVHRLREAADLAELRRSGHHGLRRPGRPRRQGRSPGQGGLGDRR